MTDRLFVFMICSAMTDAATALNQTHPSDARQGDGQRDWARPWLERQLAILGRLAEDGLEIAQAIKRQAVQAVQAVAADDPAPAPKVVRGDVTVAYARAARAVRLTLMLQAKVIEAIQALDRKQSADAAAARTRAEIDRPGLIRRRKHRVQRAVWRVASGAFDDNNTLERLFKEAGECLDADDIYGDILDTPMSELIAAICNDLGLSPDWPTLAQEAWAKGELESGKVGAPLAALAANDPGEAPVGAEPSRAFFDPPRTPSDSDRPAPS